MIYRYMESPVGRLLLAGQDGVLKVIRFSSGRKARGPEPGWQRHAEPLPAEPLPAEPLHTVEQQLTEYFAGLRQRFDVPIGPDATPFQARVLEALLAIPYGETRSYKDIAVALGNPRAMRAVGGANGSNPLPIIIPCHRVIGSGGGLTGFGGGLDTKRFLLDLERRHSGLFAGAG